MSTTEITIRTVADRGEGPGMDFEYSRVIGFDDYEQDSYLGLADIPSGLLEIPAKDKVLTLPDRLAGRFLGVLRTMANDDEILHFNCHKFGRIMIGGLMEGGLSMGDSFPAFIPSLEQASDTRLGLGQLGVIGSSDTLVMYHTLIGLGEDTPESLQVLSFYGELAIVETEKVLESYKSGFEEDTGIALYRPGLIKE